jgi:hypothetical protein
MAPVTGTDDGTAGYGVEGISPSSVGVWGQVGSRDVGGKLPLHPPPPPPSGVVGYGYLVGAAYGYGVYGESAGQDGVYGTGVNGVHGSSGVAAGSGTAPANGAGVWGESAAGSGVWGTSTGFDGVHGVTSSAQHAGVSGVNTSGGAGVFGSSTGNAGEFDGNVAVSGNLNGTFATFTGTVTGQAGQIEANFNVGGNVTVSGSILVDGDVVLQNPGQDCAEDFDVSEGDLSAGTVVVMGEDGSVRSCDSEYATTVVGIISGAGGLRPGITLGRRPSATPRLPVALLGTAYCKVDAAQSPISVGDLLTTSKTPGHAMRASDPGRAFGSVIGKALRGLAEGQGIIPVLVALQ